MVRLLLVTVPADHAALAWKVLQALHAEHDVFHLVSLRRSISSSGGGGGGVAEMRCKAKEKSLERVLEALESVGCGVHWGQIDVLVVALYKPAISSLYDARSSHGHAHALQATMDDLFDAEEGHAHSHIHIHRDRERDPSAIRDGIEMIVTQSNPMRASHSESSCSPRQLNQEQQQLPSPSCESSSPIPDSFSFSSIYADSSPPLVLPPRRKFRISDRMTIDEIASCIDDGGRLTFNFLALVTCASLMAGVGLVCDSATIVIASMLVSPLLGPILSITFGLAVWSQPIMHRGMRNEIIGVVISFFTGIFIGFIVSRLYHPDHFQRSYEIASRGEAAGLVAGLLVAMASGFAVVLGITTGGINAVVGTAISVSLLPPIVNSGMCLALSTVYSHSTDDVLVYATELLQFSKISFYLFLVNFVGMIAVGFATFRFIKKVSPKL